MARALLLLPAFTGSRCVALLGTAALAAAASMPMPAAGAAAAAAPAAATATPASRAAGSTAATSTTPAWAAGSASGAADSGLFEVKPAPACHDPMCVWFDSNRPDQPGLTLSRTHMVALNPDVVVTTRGISHITADRVEEEEGANNGTSRWMFTGHVHADMASGQLRSDSATVQIVDRRIASIVAQGNPALFQRPAAGTPQAIAAGAAPPSAGSSASSAGRTGSAGSALGNLSVRGHANTITYDAGRGEVQFSGDSWFSDGCNEITSPLLTYNLNTQTVQASGAADGGGRVHGTIRNTRPGSSGGCAADSGSS